MANSTQTISSIQENQSSLSSLATAGFRGRAHVPGKYFVIFGMIPLAVLAMLVAGYLLQQSRYQSPVTLEHRKNAQGVTQAYYPLEEFIVDLSPDNRGRIAFLKVVPAIAINNSNEEIVIKTIDTMKPRIEERITLFLRALKPEDFRTTKQLNRIKYEMTRRVNLGAGSDVAVDVVLEQLVIQ